MSTEEDAVAKAIARWSAAAHAVQSGVAMEMNYNSKPTEPKHLRVGINTALIDHGSLVGLLVRKGIITEIEYLTAIADGMETEKRKYEDRISEHLGGKRVTLA